MDVLGIDIGGSGIKGAIVDTRDGTLKTERYRVPTPKKPMPSVLIPVLAGIARHFQWHGPIGCGFPGVVRHGVVATAVNLHASWHGVDLAADLAEATGCSVSVINDADAAGVAELAYGAAREEVGTFALITVGTGLGTALFTAGRLWPNAELGHLHFNGHVAESHAADRVRKELGLTRLQWAERLNAYLLELQRLLWPDLFIIGGGASKKFDEFARAFSPELRVVPAALRNQAGMIGAAAQAAHEEAGAYSE